MKQFLFTIYVLITLCGTAQDTAFIATYGNIGNEEGRQIIATSDGGYAVVGSTSSSCSGNSDMLLIKIDSLGAFEWSAIYGSIQTDRANSIDTTIDGGFIIAGYTNGLGAGAYDALLVKTDANGSQEWIKTFGGTDWDLAHSVQTTIDSGFIVAGETYSFGNGSNDAWLIKTDKDGNQTWSKTIGGNGEDAANEIKQTADSGYIFTGYSSSFGSFEPSIWLVKTDQTGDTIWTRTYGGDSLDIGYSVIENALDTTYTIGGSVQSMGAGGHDLYLFKTDATGNMIWDDIIGGPDNEQWLSVCTINETEYLVCGYSFTIIGAGNEDVFYYRITSTGIFIQLNTIGGALFDRAYSILPSDEGGFVMTGYTNSFGYGANDVYVIKTKADGTTGLAPIQNILDTVCISVGTDEERIEIGYVIYPQPASNTAIIELNKPINETVTLTISDLLGREISITNHTSDRITVPRSHLTAGQYLFHISTSSKGIIASGTIQFQ